MMDEAVVHEFFAAMSRQDLEGLESRLQPAARFEFPKTRTLVGRDEVLRFFRILFRRYPRLEFTIRRTVLQGDRAAVHWTNAGQTRDGAPYANEGVTLLESAGGAFTWLSDFFKDTGAF